jgi:CheY-like chemotaxis protein
MRNDYDLILTDIYMLGATALEVILQVEERPRIGTGMEVDG